MADFFFPANVIPSRSDVTYVDSTARFQSALSGAVRTVSRPGERVKLTLNFTNLSAGKRSQLHALVAKLRGGSNRVYIPFHGMAPRGSFPTTQLLLNNNFASGTADFTESNLTLSASDGVLRLQPSTNGFFSLYQSVGSLDPYGTYALRSFIENGLNASNFSYGIAFGPSEYVAGGTGLRTLVGAPSIASQNVFSVICYTLGGFANPSHFYIPYTSFSKAAMVDGGGNLLLRSEDFTTTWANTRSTDAANSETAPDGATTADSIIEDATASNTHYIQQSATVASTADLEYAGSVYLKAGTRTWAAVVLLEGTGSTAVRQYVNLSTGALGTLSAGANWSEQRAYVTSVGNGWYRVAVVAKKTNTATSVSLRVELATGNGTNSYTGNGTSLIYAWGGQLTQGGLPVRYTATTTAAVATASQTGTGIHVKGLPASTNGLLVAGDWIEVGGEIHQVAQALNSDAAGLGYLALSRPVRAAKTNDTAVIIGEPVGKFLLEDSENGWSNAPGNFSDASLTFIEDITA